MSATATTDEPNIVYGRLLESAHISGYGFGRAVDEHLVDLLTGDRWQHVGPGFTKVDDFLRSVDLSAFNLNDKPALHRLIKALQPEATVRAIGEATGTPKSTVDRHLAGVPNGTTAPPVTTSERVLFDDDVPNGTADPPHVTRNTGNDEWYTPAPYIEAARDVLGAIDLDPASSRIANDVVRAEHFHTIDDDGLAVTWAGRVWMNPPYSTGLVDRFVHKLVDSYDHGAVTAAIALTNNATETRWWQALARRSTAVCMLSGRIKFRSATGEVAGAGLQGQTIAYLGDDRDAFDDRFSEFGVVL